MVNIIIKADSRYPINRLSIRAAVMGVLSKHKVSGDVEIGVSIVGDRKMHELNKVYRGKDSTTDVLSFALEDPSPTFLQQLPANIAGFIAAPDDTLRLGDIIVSHPEAMKDASLDGKSLDEEISFLVEHGTEHLLGIHHPE